MPRPQIMRWSYATPGCGPSVLPVAADCQQLDDLITAAGRRSGCYVDYLVTPPFHVQRPVASEGKQPPSGACSAPLPFAGCDHLQKLSAASAGSSVGWTVVCPGYSCSTDSEIFGHICGNGETRHTDHYSDGSDLYGAKLTVHGVGADVYIVASLRPGRRSCDKPSICRHNDHAVSANDLSG